MQQNFQTPGSITATVDLGVGAIQISASDRADTLVDVRPTDPSHRRDVAAAEEIIVECVNGRLLVRSPKNWRRWSPRGGHESVDVRIDLPAGSTLRVDAGVASIRCTGRLGESELKTGVGDIEADEVGSVVVRTGAGDVTLDRVDGSAEVASGSGAVSIASVAARAVVRDGNGAVWIGEVAGEAHVKAANGRITIDRARHSVTAKTANGPVRVGEVERGSVVAQSAFGTIEVGVRDGVAVWLDLDTKYGHVRNDLEAADRPEPTEDMVEIHAHTAAGDITIHRVLGSDVAEASARS
jgi:hypothetical protein